MTHPITMYRQIVNINGVDIFYRDTQTAGPIILCLHGRWGRGETWADFIQHYGGKFRVIAPDLRGHGLSDKSTASYTHEDMAADMAALLVHLKVDSAIVAGHSMGGFVAGCLAATHPEQVKALAILDKSAGGPVRVTSEDPLTTNWPMPFASLAEAQAFLHQTMESELSYNYFMASLIETVAGYQMLFSQQAMAANITSYHHWFHLLPHIKCPVLLVRSSSKDAVTDEDWIKMQSLLPGCAAREMSHPDHNVHLGNKEQFYGFFDTFLSRL